MTKEEFIQFYATNVDLTMTEIKNLKLIPVKCNCGERACKGWKIKHG